MGKQLNIIKEAISQGDAKFHEGEYLHRSMRAMDNYEVGRPLIAAKHMETAEAHAKAYHRLTGKKIHDPMYTGSSRHITSVKESLEESSDLDAYKTRITLANVSSRELFATGHRVAAEKHAADYFRKTGKKIYDPSYVGSSRHITSVKESSDFHGLGYDTARRLHGGMGGGGMTHKETMAAVKKVQLRTKSPEERDAFHAGAEHYCRKHCVKESLGEARNKFDTWHPEEHAKAYHRNMSDHEDWEHEGIETGNERCFDRADDHLEAANFHAQKHFDLTGRKIRQPNRSFRKKSNPQHVEESAEHPQETLAKMHNHLFHHHDKRFHSAENQASEFPHIHRHLRDESAAKYHNLTGRRLMGKDGQVHPKRELKVESYLGEEKITNKAMADHYDAEVRHLETRSAAQVAKWYGPTVKPEHAQEAHKRHIAWFKRGAAHHRKLAAELGESSIAETLRAYKPKQVKRTAEELYHHHMGKHFEHWDKADEYSAASAEWHDDPKKSVRARDRYAYHMDMSLAHADKAEEYASDHFHKTGQKIKDTGYTGNSPHIDGR